jgi:hypothetical protein
MGVEEEKRDGEFDLDSAMSGEHANLGETLDQMRHRIYGEDVADTDFDNKWARCLKAQNLLHRILRTPYVVPDLEGRKPTQEDVSGLEIDIVAIMFFANIPVDRLPIFRPGIEMHQASTTQSQQNTHVGVSRP